MGFLMSHVQFKMLHMLRVPRHAPHVTHVSYHVTHNLQVWNRNERSYIHSILMGVIFKMSSREAGSVTLFLRRCRALVLNAIENIESGRNITDSINLIEQVEANFERLRGGIQNNDIDNVVAILGGISKL